MKNKTKTTFAALILGVLTYLAWLSYDIKNPEAVTPEATPYQVNTEAPVPEVAAPLPAAAPVKKHVMKVKKAEAAAVVEPAPETTVAQIPLPTLWNGQFENHELRAQNNVCDELDRPCSPRGRDGVLLAGVSIPLNGLSPQLPQNLAVGSYEERMPLLVYR